MQWLKSWRKRKPSNNAIPRNARIISTAFKGREYAKDLQALAGHQPLMQELSERRLALAMAVGQLDIEAPQFERRICRLQGQIDTITWIMTDLINFPIPIHTEEDNETITED